MRLPPPSVSSQQPKCSHHCQVSPGGRISSGAHSALGHQMKPLVHLSPVPHLASYVGLKLYPSVPGFPSVSHLGLFF